MVFWIVLKGLLNLSASCRQVYPSSIMHPQDLFHDWPWCDVVPGMFWHMDLSSLSLLYLFSSLLSIVHFSWGGADGAEVELMHTWTHIIFELCHVRQPLFVGLFRVELAVQHVFRQILRV